MHKCSFVARLLVLRHAQSVWNAQGLFQGWSDAPLSELGEAQATRGGRALAADGVKPGLVACSDLSRARRTAELVAAETGYDKAPLVDPGLREQDLGYWNGLSRAEIEPRWPSELAERERGRGSDVPGGELGRAFAERCIAALERVAAELIDGGDGVGIVVTHGGVVIALEEALGARRAGLGHPNLSGWWLEVTGSRGLVEMSASERVELGAAGVENAVRSL